LFCHHTLQFLVGLGVFGLELRSFESEALTKLLHLSDGVAQLVETDMKVPLLFLQFVAFLIEQVRVMVDAVSNISIMRLKSPESDWMLTNRGNA
jgi:hypothetical protein